MVCADYKGNHPPIMRLLSFFNQVETTLAMLRPECSVGWSRRADYQQGIGTYWHRRMGLSLSVRAYELGEDRYSLQTSWSGPGEQILFERTFFCGSSPADWQGAADAVAEGMPELPLAEAVGDVSGIAEGRYAATA